MVHNLICFSISLNYIAHLNFPFITTFDFPIFLTLFLWNKIRNISYNLLFFQHKCRNWVKIQCTKTISRLQLVTASRTNWFPSWSEKRQRDRINWNMKRTCWWAPPQDVRVPTGTGRLLCTPPCTNHLNFDPPSPLPKQKSGSVGDQFGKQWQKMKPTVLGRFDRCNRLSLKRFT